MDILWNQSVNSNIHLEETSRKFEYNLKLIQWICSNGKLTVAHTKRQTGIANAINCKCNKSKDLWLQNTKIFETSQCFKCQIWPCMIFEIYFQLLLKLKIIQFLIFENFCMIHVRFLGNYIWSLYECQAFAQIIYDLVWLPRIIYEIVWLPSFHLRFLPLIIIWIFWVLVFFQKTLNICFFFQVEKWQECFQIHSQSMTDQFYNKLSSKSKHVFREKLVVFMALTITAYVFPSFVILLAASLSCRNNWRPNWDFRS